jgi:hypothetical protein
MLFLPSSSSRVWPPTEISSQIFSLDYAPDQKPSFRFLIAPFPLDTRILQAGADLNVQDVDGWTAIHNSARNGRNRCVTKLLEKGASMMIKTRWEETPLHVACRKGKAKIVAEMVSFAKQQKTGGAPGDLYKSLLSAKDSEGRTPEDLSSSEHIRGILRGEGIESGYEIATSGMGMMTLPRGNTLTNFGGPNNGQAISESLRKGTGMSRTCTIL